jgi:alpha-glucosidase (family GH31 glycosyl hydrolase)
MIDRDKDKIYIKDENDITLLESYDGLAGFLSYIGNSEGRIHSFKLNFKVFNNSYFGFGEKFDRLNQKGLRPKSYVFNQPGNQKEKTYLPVPFFFTESGYGMYIDTSYEVDFELAANKNDLLEINVRTNTLKPCLDFYIFFGQPKEVIRKYLGMTGFPKLPPKWVFGPWISSNGWNTQKEVLKQVDEMNKQDIPASVVVIEAWSDENTYYLFNDSVYQTMEGDKAVRYDDLRYTEDGMWPDPKSMVDYIHKNNMKLVLWQIPVIKSKASNTIVQHMSDRRYAVDNKLCVTYEDGTPYTINYDWFSHSMLPDFTNPQTREWWAKKRRYLCEELGVDGFKTDGGEFVFDDDVIFSNGEDGAQMRNKYPQYYVSTYHEFMRDNMVTFSRAGFRGSQKYPIYWSGDQCSTFSELRSIITANLSINISGNPFCGFDLGGFIHEIPTPELFIRGAQFAAFSPVMQFHSEAGTRENNDRSPWNMADRTGDKRVLDIYRKLAAIRMNCIPYIYNEARHISHNGEPLMRPLFIDNPGDGNVFDLEFEYMFGRSLLVAPITEEGIWQRDIYLPEGEWIDFWDGNVHEGRRSIRYTCNLERIPVFMKRGAVIPLNLNKDFEIGGHIGNNLNEYEKLCFVLTGELEYTFEFSDDNGNTILFDGRNGGLEVKKTGTVEKIYLLSKEELCGYEKQREKTLNGTCYGIYECI